jgi:hypothetical protein
MASRCPSRGAANKTGRHAAMPLVQPGRANHIVAHPKQGQLPVQPEVRRPGFVTTDDLLGQGLLLFNPRQKGGGGEGLRRLGFGPVHHAYRHDAGRVDVQGQLELLAQRLCFSRACDLLPASLRVRTLLVGMHTLVDVATCLRVRQLSCHLSVPGPAAALRVLAKKGCSHLGKEFSDEINNGDVV